MAGRPLRPATRRSLGRPLPHQQADRTRSHRIALKRFPTHPCEHVEHSALPPVSRSYSKLHGRLITRYSPVRHSHPPSKLERIPFDLHVLSTPPAFVLSQNQTLHKKHEESQYMTHKNKRKITKNTLQKIKHSTHKKQPNNKIIQLSLALSKHKK